MEQLGFSDLIPDLLKIQQLDNMSVELTHLKRLVDSRIARAFQETTIMGSGAIMVAGVPGDYVVSLEPSPAQTTRAKKVSGVVGLPRFVIVTENGVKYIKAQYGGTAGGVWSLGHPSGVNANDTGAFKVALGSGKRVYGEIVYEVTEITVVYTPAPEFTFKFQGEIRITSMKIRADVGTYGTAPVSSTKSVSGDILGPPGTMTDYLFAGRWNANGAEDPLSGAEASDDYTALGGDDSPWSYDNGRVFTGNT